MYLNIGVKANVFVMAFCTSVSALTPVNKKNVKYIPFSLQIFPKPSIFVPKSDDSIQFIRSIIPYNMHHSSPKSKNQSCNGDVGI